MALSLDDIESTLSILETGKPPERRKYVRKKASIEFNYLTKSRDGDWMIDPIKNAKTAKIINISRQGVAINTDVPFHVGDHFYIQTSGGSTQIVAEIKVINFRRTGVGLHQYGCKFLACDKKAVSA